MYLTLSIKGKREKQPPNLTGRESLPKENLRLDGNSGHVSTFKPTKEAITGILSATTKLSFTVVLKIAINTLCIELLKKV